jgi:hypothetical protein
MVRIKAIWALPLICISLAGVSPRWIEGVYQNPALGFSIRIPRGLRGLSGDQSGPERGVRISLPSSGEVAVFGEPNSLEWNNPADAVSAYLKYEGALRVTPSFRWLMSGSSLAPKALSFVAIASSKSCRYFVRAAA